MACLVMLVRRFGSRSREGLPLPLRSAGLRPSFCPAHLPRLLRSSCHSLLKRTSVICSNRRQNRLRKRWFSVTVSSLLRHRLHQGLSRNHLHSRLHRSTSVAQFTTHIFQSFSFIISSHLCYSTFESPPYSLILVSLHSPVCFIYCAPISGI